MRILSLKEFFNKTVPKENLEEFLQDVKHVNDTRKKNFFKLFIFIQLVVLITSIFNIHTIIFRYIIWMSITMIILSALSLLILYKADDSIKLILEFPILFSVMLWSVLYAFIDSNFYGLNMVYIATIIFLSAMHLGPSKIIIASVMAHVIFIIGIIDFSQSKEQLLINIVDTTILVIMACFLAIKLYHNFINSFNKNKIIENRSEDLNIINKRLEKEIYERKVIAYHLKENKEKFRLFSQNSPSAIVLIQHDKIVYVNPSTVKLTGYKVEELYKMNWSDLIHDDMRDSIKRGFLEVQLGEEFIDCNEVKIKSKSGEIHWINVSANRVVNEGEIGVIVNAYDISEEKEAKRRIERLYEEIINLSRYDKLTNVYNRRYFEDLFDEHFKIANEINKKFFFVLFDLNGMKEVNDIYGHLAGDEFLKKFADTIKENSREADLFARYGGDEFVAVFFNINQKDLELKLEKINKELIETPLDFQGNSIECSFSYGVVNFPNEAKNYNDLVKLADERMYSYKEKIKVELKNME